ncbi:uncharacterized protein BDW70DRAFT_135562 [Aspergillus foveolatus]|uniref:uncharacterized protein n=1 Tax=Aspergillus foveolatus TaxID=210207 RepID=UPI003CCCAEF9
MLLAQDLGQACKLAGSTISTMTDSRHPINMGVASAEEASGTPATPLFVKKLTTGVSQDLKHLEKYEPARPTQDIDSILDVICVHECPANQTSSFPDLHGCTRLKKLDILCLVLISYTHLVELLGSLLFILSSVRTPHVSLQGSRWVCIIFREDCPHSAF